MDYPGRVIKLGETDPQVVPVLAAQLNRVLALPPAEALSTAAGTTFDAAMKRAVQTFQARNLDDQGNPLKADGEIGSITWGVLFGAGTVPMSSAASDPFLAHVLQIARAEEKAQVREVPVNSNRGPRVEQYLARAGVGPGLAWCCAFTYWCFDEAAKAEGRKNPMFKTAGCLAHWNGAPTVGARRIQKFQAVADPSLVQPGMVFIMDFGGGAGHTGFIEAVSGGHINTIEGNTDASQTREGGGVYRLTRKIADISKGFIDYSGL